MDVDAIIAEAQAPVAAQTQPEIKAEAVVEVKPADEVTETEQESPEETQEESTPDPESEKRKLTNKLAKEQRRIGRLTAEKYQHERERDAEREEVKRLQAKLAMYEAGSNKPQDGKPREEDFEGRPYGDYLDALTDWKFEQKLQANQAKESEQKTKLETQNWHQERSDALDDNAEQAKEAFPDFQRVIDKAIPQGGLAPHVRKAFLAADNGAYALYALAKEGTLEDLNDMSPERAAMQIGRMEDKGLSLSKQKTKTNAPAPLSPAKGTGSGGKSLHEQSIPELMKMFNNKD
jgi:hypothetical protein